MSFNPKVDIAVRTALSLIPTAGDTISIMLGTAQYGPINEVITCTNFNEVLNVFQEDVDTHTTILKGAELFFSNGGAILKVVRVADATAAIAAYSANGPVETGVITFSAKYKGTYGNNISVDIDAMGTGRIARIKINNTVELFDNNGATNGYTTNALLVAAINDSSEIITATVNNAELVSALSSYAQFIDGLSGTTATSLIYTTAFDNILLDEDWSILMIPNTYQTVSIEDTDAFQTTISAKVVNRSDIYNKQGIFVSGISDDETITIAQTRTTRDERFILAAPSIEHTSRTTGDSEYLDGTYLACALSGQISKLDALGNAVTRKVVVVNDLSVLVSSGKKYYNSVEIEQLLSAGICCASRINNELKWARGITRVTDTSSIYFEINILRIVDNIKDLIRSTLDDYLGEPTSQITRDRMQAVVNGVLNQQESVGLITEYLPTVVTEGVSPDTVTVAVSIKPAYATNFINVTITVS